MGSSGLIGGRFDPAAAPGFLSAREAVFNRLWEQQQAVVRVDLFYYYNFMSIL